MLSKYFLSSHFIQSVEFKDACEKMQRREAVIFPFVLDSYKWLENPKISQIQVFSRTGNPYSKHKVKNLLLNEFCVEVLHTIGIFQNQINAQQEIKRQQEIIEGLTYFQKEQQRKIPLEK